MHFFRAFRAFKLEALVIAVRGKSVELSGQGWLTSSEIFFPRSLELIASDQFTAPERTSLSNLLLRWLHSTCVSDDLRFRQGSLFIYRLRHFYPQTECRRVHYKTSTFDIDSDFLFDIQTSIIRLGTSQLFCYYYLNSEHWRLWIITHGNSYWPRWQKRQLRSAASIREMRYTITIIIRYNHHDNDWQRRWWLHHSAEFYFQSRATISATPPV